MMHSGWKSIGKVFIVATILEVAFEYVVFRDFRPVATLLAGPLLALVPYLLLRGPVNRLMRQKAIGEGGAR